jgi:hypothetical protein
MRILSIISLLLFSVSVVGQTTDTFSTLQFDEVIMFDFSGGKNANLYIVDKNGKLATSIIKSVKLDKTTIATLNSKLNSKKSFGSPTASCFEPHLGFVYYFKGKIVGHITICLDCNKLVSSLDIPAQKQGKIGQGKDVYYIADGLSEDFRRFLQSLLEKKSFSHQAG